MKTLLLVNISALGLLLSFVAFASAATTEGVAQNLHKALSQTDNKPNKINVVKERLAQKRMASRIIDRPVISPLHFR